MRILLQILVIGFIGCEKGSGSSQAPISESPIHQEFVAKLHALEETGKGRAFEMLLTSKRPSLLKR